MVKVLFLLIFRIDQQQDGIDEGRRRLEDILPESVELENRKQVWLRKKIIFKKNYFELTYEYVHTYVYLGKTSMQSMPGGGNVWRFRTKVGLRGAHLHGRNPLWSESECRGMRRIQSGDRLLSAAVGRFLQRRLYGCFVPKVMQQ